VQDLWNKVWREQDGRGGVVIWQNPNPFLIAWAILTVISLLFGGTLSDIISWAAHAALIIWALLEIFKGVNYFRRGLGVVVLLFAIMSLMQNL
jgi:hypothetical protein